MDKGGGRGAERRKLDKVGKRGLFLGGPETSCWGGAAERGLGINVRVIKNAKGTVQLTKGKECMNEFFVTELKGKHG